MPSGRITEYSSLDEGRLLNELQPAGVKALTEVKPAVLTRQEEEEPADEDEAKTWSENVKAAKRRLFQDQPLGVEPKDWLVDDSSRLQLNSGGPNG